MRSPIATVRLSLVTPSAPTPARAQALACALAVAFTLLAAGCTAPPSVYPLLRIVDRTLERERRHLDADAGRIESWHLTRRRTLRAAFDADLHARPTLTADWVDDHVTAYAAALEAMLVSERSTLDAVETRRENLRLAGEAQRRALTLLESQDALLGFVTDLRHRLTPQLTGGQRDDRAQRP